MNVELKYIYRSNPIFVRKLDMGPRALAFSMYPGLPRGGVWRLGEGQELLGFPKRCSYKESLSQPEESILGIVRW